MTIFMTNNKRADVEFDERNVPISRQFDDPYYSFDNGLAESEYVFLRGNDLKARLQDGFHVGELGFGTGLNFLLTWQLWRKLGRGGKVTFTSFEAYPMEPQTRAKALANFAELVPLIDIFTASFDGQNFEDDTIKLRVIEGDARETLPAWNGRADAWYLDGFSPAKNPELWGADLMQAVHEHCQPEASFATYTAAGFVRRNLQDAGFALERIKGFGTKRHMLRGRY